MEHLRLPRPVHRRPAARLALQGVIAAILTLFVSSITVALPASPYVAADNTAAATAHIVALGEGRMADAISSATPAPNRPSGDPGRAPILAAQRADAAIDAAEAAALAAAQAQAAALAAAQAQTAATDAAAAARAAAYVPTQAVTTRAAVPVAPAPTPRPTPAPVTYAGTNRFWFPSLGIGGGVGFMACYAPAVPGLSIYRWGCAGSNNVYLLAHAGGAFLPLYNAYNAGRLSVGMLAVYADANGTSHYFRLSWWRVTPPLTSSSWAWDPQPVSSLTLQTCVGPNSSLRLFVRFLEVAHP